MMAYSIIFAMSTIEKNLQTLVARLGNRFRQEYSEETITAMVNQWTPKGVEEWLESVSDRPSVCGLSISEAEQYPDIAFRYLVGELQWIGAKIDPSMVDLPGGSTLAKVVNTIVTEKKRYLLDTLIIDGKKYRPKEGVFTLQKSQSELGIQDVGRITYGLSTEDLYSLNRCSLLHYTSDDSTNVLSRATLNTTTQNTRNRLQLSLNYYNTDGQPTPYERSTCIHGRLQEYYGDYCTQPQSFTLRISEEGGGIQYFRSQ